MKYYNNILLGVLANIITCMVGWTHFVDGVKGHPFCLLEVYGWGGGGGDTFGVSALLCICMLCDCFST